MIKFVTILVFALVGCTDSSGGKHLVSGPANQETVLETKIVGTTQEDGSDLMIVESDGSDNLLTAPETSPNKGVALMLPKGSLAKGSVVSFIEGESLLTDKNILDLNLPASSMALSKALFVSFSLTVSSESPLRITLPISPTLLLIESPNIFASFIFETEDGFMTGTVTGEGIVKADSAYHAYLNLHGKSLRKLSIQLMSAESLPEEIFASTTTSPAKSSNPSISTGPVVNPNIPSTPSQPVVLVPGDVGYSSTNDLRISTTLQLLDTGIAHGRIFSKETITLIFNETVYDAKIYNDGFFYVNWNNFHITPNSGNTLSIIPESRDGLNTPRSWEIGTQNIPINVFSVDSGYKAGFVVPGIEVFDCEAKGGYIEENKCFFMGDEGESCDTVCSAKGLNNNTRANWVFGAKDIGRCQNIIDHFWALESHIPVYGHSIGPVNTLGCSATEPSISYLHPDQAFDSSASWPDVRRICSCS